LQVSTADELVSVLSTAPYSKPMVVGTVLSNCGREDIRQDLISGLQSLKLIFFPKVRITDLSKHKRANWNGKHVLRVLYPGGPLDIDALCLSMSGDVMMQLESREIMYADKIQELLKTNFVTLPWAKVVGYIS
jgi:hypothetical protein